MGDPTMHLEQPRRTPSSIGTPRGLALVMRDAQEIDAPDSNGNRRAVVSKIGSQQNLRYTYALGENTQVIASLDSHRRQRVKLSGLGALEAPCVNLSKRRLGRVARHGGLLGSDLCDCKCAPEIVSTKKRGETTVAGCAASNNVGRGKTP
jgi:hypothetical protein